MLRRIIQVFGSLLLIAASATAANAITLFYSMTCPATTVVGPITILSGTSTGTLELAPNAAQVMGLLPTNNITQVNNPAAAAGTYTGVLSCTFTINGVTVPFTRSLSLAVTAAQQGLITTGETAFSLNLGPVGVVSISAPAATTLGFNRNLIVNGIIVVPLIADTTVVLQIPIAVPLADYLPLMLMATILFGYALTRRRTAKTP